MLLNSCSQQEREKISLVRGEANNITVIINLFSTTLLWSSLPGFDNQAAITPYQGKTLNGTPPPLNG